MGSYRIDSFDPEMIQNCFDMNECKWILQCTKCFHPFTLLKHIACESSSERLIDTSAAPTGTTDSRLSQERNGNMNRNPKTYAGPCQNHTSVTIEVDSPEPLVCSSAWPLNWRCTSKTNRSCSWWHKKPKSKMPQESQEHVHRDLYGATGLVLLYGLCDLGICQKPRFQAKWTHYCHSAAWSGMYQSLQLRYACKWCSLQSINRAYNICTRNVPKTNVRLESGHPCWA